MNDKYIEFAWQWLKGEGFKKKKRSFYKDFDDLIIIIDFQKVGFLEAYYINFAVWIKCLAPAIDPSAIKENNCHVKIRLERMLPEFSYTIRSLADRSRLSSSELQTLNENYPGIFGEPLRENIILFSNVDNLKKLYKKGILENAMIRKEAKDILSS